jgi:hypothetical protein
LQLKGLKHLNQTVYFCELTFVYETIFFSYFDFVVDGVDVAAAAAAADAAVAVAAEAAAPAAAAVALVVFLL